MRVTIVQYGGDYRETWRRFQAGGEPTYQAQRYSVAVVEKLAARVPSVTILCATTEAAYDTVLPNGVRSIGAGFKAGFSPSQLVQLVAPTRPTHMVLVTPLIPLLTWAESNEVRVVATLADSFEEKGLRRFISHKRLAWALNRPNVSWVGNHGISACLSLAQIGVNKDKIIPWDWPPSHCPDDYPVRTRGDSNTFKLIYVGSVTEQKGVGDVLRSLVGLSCSLRVIGHDENGQMSSLSERLNLGGRVEFSGMLPNDKIIDAMRLADAVVIPSRHEYPEGLPLTIYEALAARTPIIASDHPMFRGALKDQISALIYPAANLDALRATISRLADDPTLYEQLSLNASDAWQQLQLPVRWGELLDKGLSDSLEDRAWLHDHSLCSGLYHEQIRARKQTQR